VHIPPSIYAPGSRGTLCLWTLLNHLDALERQRTQEVMP
jgi:chromosome partitioning protein